MRFTTSTTVAFTVFQLCNPFAAAFLSPLHSIQIHSRVPFAAGSSTKWTKIDHQPLYSSSEEEDQVVENVDGDVDNVDVAVEETISMKENNNDLERTKLKNELLKLSASYDRGYGATSTSRKSANAIIDRLQFLNPTPQASRGIDGDDTDENTPLKGIWQMVWTTAQDVLILNASPFSTVGAIYQVITDPPIITNVIDLIPRSQALLPINIAPSLLRLKVTTRAKSRSDPNRIGLTFEKVQAQPMQILGFDNLDDFLPPLFQFNLPTLSNIPEIVQSTLNIDMSSDNSPGFFDVLYLDEELLIIAQNEPGGIFVLVKSDSFDP